MNDARKPDPRAAMLARLDNDYRYHAPFGDQVDRYQAIRDKAKELATLIVDTSPTSREQSTALTHLETAVMFANAAIARNEQPPTVTFEEPAQSGTAGYDDHGTMRTSPEVR